MRELIEIGTQQLAQCNTEVLFIDELHNLGHTLHGASGEATDVLKALMNRAQCTFVLSGIGLEANGMLDGPRGTQIAGRCVLQKLTPYRYSNEADRAGWSELIALFEEELYLIGHRAGTLPALGEYLHKRTRGHIAYLADLLTSAAVDLILGEAEEPGLPAERITRAVLDATQTSYAAEVAYLMASEGQRAKRSKRQVGRSA